jgi:proton-dependent oligopeptide transporter, POT family
MTSIALSLRATRIASQLFGFYTGLAYFTPILGGLVADRLLGRRRTVIIGGLLMALGHFMMAFEALFLLALLLLIVGIGAFRTSRPKSVRSMRPATIGATAPTRSSISGSTSGHFWCR